MDEAKFNTCFKNSLNKIDTWFSYKMPDATYGIKSIEKPYDLYAEGRSKFLAFEGKKIRGIQALNFNVFEQQQLPCLKHAWDNGHLALVGIYIYIPRKSFMFLFSVDVLLKLQEQGKKSILKKEFELFIKDYALYIKKELFDLINFEDKIITIEKWEKIVGNK